MKKELLEQAVSLGYSTRKIAEEFNISQTSIRYWLNKYGLKTKSSLPIDGTCEHCGKSLIGRQTKFCSRQCKNDYYNKKTDGESSRSYQRQKLDRIKRKIDLVLYRGGKCSVCGYDKNYSALAFHHKKDKKFALSSKYISSKKWESILEEAKKCDVMCCNCHSEIHNPHLFDWHDDTVVWNYGIQRRIHFVKELGGECSACGYDANLAALNFHHSFGKDFKLDACRMNKTNMKRLEEEVEKCSLLCVNCHFEHHHPECNDWKEPGGAG